MADVQPFRGIRYNLERIGDLSPVISPPYDVISPQEQRLYHDKSPYNVIRLEFGEERAGDSARDNKYTRAALTLESWLRQGVLVREERPAFYLVEHRFRYQNSTRSRFGLIACVGLEELGSGTIRPHEMTMRGPAIDRLFLLQACRSNFNPIMGIFRSEGEGIGWLFQEVAVDRPALEAMDDNGVSYRVWMVSEGERIAAITRFFRDKAIYIADGHHRYETALAYCKKRRAALPSFTGGEAFNFVMMALMDSQDPDLIMYPTHRLVRGIAVEGLEERLDAYFDRELLHPQGDLSYTMEGWLDELRRRGREGTAFALYGLHRRHLCLLKLRHQGAARERMSAAWPSPLRELDVSLLHWVILRQMLGIDSAEKEESSLEYTRDGLAALSRVDSGEFQLAFLLNPAPISSVLAVADAGVRMPQKSTYFYPKTPTGLVINPLWDDE